MTLTAFALGLAAPPSTAQQGQQGGLRLRGRVMQGDVGVTSGIAVLHRVSLDVAGEVDSVSIAPDGGFEFAIPRLPSVSAQAEILFASVRHEGVLYFGSPITEPEQLDSLYVIEVFGAEEAPLGGAELPLSVRNVFLERWGEGWRVTDLFQILNGGERTLVAAEEGVVWSYPLPSGAASPELGQGDLPPDAVTFAGGRVLVRAPLPPGERMLLIRYELPATDVEFPAPGATETLELLVKEPAPSLEVAGLQPVDVVALDAESSYRRYSGTGLRDVVVSVEARPEGRRPSMGLFAALLAALLGGVAAFAYARPRGSAGARSAPAERGDGAAPSSDGERERLILRVAQLDESLSATGDAEVRGRLLEERSVLIARLRAQR